MRPCVPVCALKMGSSPRGQPHSALCQQMRYFGSRPIWQLLCRSMLHLITGWHCCPYVPMCALQKSNPPHGHPVQPDFAILIR